MVFFHKLYAWILIKFADKITKNDQIQIKLPKQSGEISSKAATIYGNFTAIELIKKTVHSQHEN